MNVNQLYGALALVIAGLLGPLTNAVADNAVQYAPHIQTKLALIEVDHHSLDHFNSLIGDYQGAQQSNASTDAQALRKSLDQQMKGAVARLEERLGSDLSYRKDKQVGKKADMRRDQDREFLQSMTVSHKQFVVDASSAAQETDGKLLQDFSRAWLRAQSNEISEAWSMILESQQ